MNRNEAEWILRQVEYWHYPVELPWGKMEATKPGHNERHLLRRQHFFEPLLKLCGGSLNGKRVLDLGCCQGHWSFEVRKAGASFCLGIDSSPDFVNQAEALGTIFGLDQCEFRCAQLEEDDWWKDLGTFHITFFLGLFYHLADPIFVLRKALSCTSETVLVDTGVFPGDASTITFVPRDLQEPTTRNSKIVSRIRAFPTRAALHDILEDGGFRTIRFLTPDVSMPADYLEGSRVSVIAQR